MTSVSREALLAQSLVWLPVPVRLGALEDTPGCHRGLAVRRRSGQALLGPLDGCLLTCRQGRVPVSRRRIPVMGRVQPVLRGGLTIRRGGPPVHPDSIKQQARRVPVGRRGFPLIGQLLPCPRRLFPHPGQPSGIFVSRGGFGTGPGRCRTGLGCPITEVGGVQPASHGHVTLQRGLVPRIRRMVASGCPHVPALRCEIAQPGGIIPDLGLMVTLIRGSPDRL